MRWFPSYSPDEDVALGGHAMLVGVYNGSVAAFAISQRRSGRGVPHHFPPGDVLLLSGLRHAVGELLSCPFCLGQWVGTGLLAAYLREPRFARTIAAAFTIVAGSDLLQETWVAVEKRA